MSDAINALNGLSGDACAVIVFSVLFLCVMAYMVIDRVCTVIERRRG